MDVGEGREDNSDLPFSDRVVKSCSEDIVVGNGVSSEDTLDFVRTKRKN